MEKTLGVGGKLAAPFLILRKMIGKKRPEMPDIKLTIKAMVRWEQMAGRSFYTLDLTAEDDIKALIYCSAICSGAVNCMSDEFQYVLKNEGFLKGFLESIDKKARIAAQFQSGATDAVNKGDGEAPGFLKDTIYTLINAGIDADFLLNRADLCDVEGLIAARERAIREDMEKRRFWAFYGIRPHIDGDKFKSPTDTLRFAWEEEPETEEITEEDREILAYFEKHGKEIFKN